MGCIPGDDRKIHRHGYKHQARESRRSATYHDEEIVPFVDTHLHFTILDRKRIGYVLRSGSPVLNTARAAKSKTSGDPGKIRTSDLRFRKLKLRIAFYGAYTNFQQLARF